MKKIRLKMLFGLMMLFAVAFLSGNYMECVYAEEDRPRFEPITYYGYALKGAFPIWSPQTDKIIFTKKDGPDANLNLDYQVWTMELDGTAAQNLECLTCNKTALQDYGHRGQAYWHPSGDYIVFSAESTLYFQQGDGVSHRPGIGRNYNVWIMNADGSQFWQITDYPKNWGAITTKFSHNGTKIYWNEEFSMEKYPEGLPGDYKYLGVPKYEDDPLDTVGHPGSYWGLGLNELYRHGEELATWRVVYAEIEFDEAGNPRVKDKNGQYLTLPFDPSQIQLHRVNPPERFTLIEASGFLPNDQGFLYAYAPLDEISQEMYDTHGLIDDGLGLWAELYTTDLNGNNLTKLTDTVLRFHEEADYAPQDSPYQGKVIYKESTKGNGFPAEGQEFFLMNSDGSNPVQLSHFSDLGHPEYASDWHQIAEFDWTPDGTRLIFGHGKEYPDPQNRINADLYLMIFPPTVTDSIPTNKAKNIATNKPLKFVFSRAMDAASVENAVQCSPELPNKAYVWNLDGTELQITHGDLAQGAAYEVTILGTAQDTTGVRLDGNADGIGGDSYVYSITTESPGECCLATQIYTTDRQKEQKLTALRSYRDNYLAKTPQGKKIIETYYECSPQAVRYLRKKPYLKRVIRRLLQPLVAEGKKLAQ